MAAITGPEIERLIQLLSKLPGLGPRSARRAVLQLIQKNQQIRWAQIAYQCGYADQSHFIREFKHFSGFNPQEYIQQGFNEDEPNFFPLDREGVKKLGVKKEE